MPKLLNTDLLKQMNSVRLKNYLKTLYSIKSKKAIYKYACGYFNFSSGSPTESKRTLVGYNLNKSELAALNSKILEVKGLIANV